MRIGEDGYIYHEWNAGISGVFGSDLISQLAENLEYASNRVAQLKHAGKIYPIPAQKH